MSPGEGPPYIPPSDPTLEVTITRLPILATLLPALLWAACGEETVPTGPPGPPVVTTVSPATLTPGVVATVRGGGFDPTAAGNLVVLGDVPLEVVAASTTELTVALPARSAFPCAPDGDATLTVTVAGESTTATAPLEVAVHRWLAVGESVEVLDADEVRCNQLDAAGAYLVAVVNTGTAEGETAPFRLRGRDATGVAVAAPATRISTLRPPPASSSAVGGPQRRSAVALHHQLLERSRRLLERLGPARPVAARAAVAPPAEGSLHGLRVPHLFSADPCSFFSEVTARVVYSGTSAVLFEDAAAPLAGTMDEHIRRLGREFDDVMMPILLENLGDPLAMDDRLDGDRRFHVLLTPLVNDLGGIGGFAAGADLVSREECPSSDVREIVYIRVATAAGTGYLADTADQWLRDIPDVLIHEAKHIVSYVERTVRDATLYEESWLEESTARIAQELYVRDHFGYGARQNLGYAHTLLCELRPSFEPCAGAPLVMWDHVLGIQEYYLWMEDRTVLGPVYDGDFSYYSSGWSFVRWATDHAGTGESSFLKALVREPDLTGVANLEARAGRSFGELLTQWALASALDDRPGFTPEDERYTLPSWNLRDMFHYLNGDYPQIFPARFPLAPHDLVDFGAFDLEIEALRTGTASLFEMWTAEGSRLLELMGPDGGAPGAGLRLAVTRLD